MLETGLQEVGPCLQVLAQCALAVFTWLVKAIPSVALFLATAALSSQKGIPLSEITVCQLPLTDTVARAGAF